MLFPELVITYVCLCVYIYIYIYVCVCVCIYTQIVKDSFDFTQRLEKQCQNNTLLSTCDIKFLYTNIRHDLFLTAIEY